MAGVRMDPKEIFELIVRADEALKYATEEKIVARTAQARRLLVQARDEATAIGNDALVGHAERRGVRRQVAGPAGRGRASHEPAGRSDRGTDRAIGVRRCAVDPGVVGGSQLEGSLHPSLECPGSAGPAGRVPLLG